MNTEKINRFDELMREKLNSYEAEPDMDLLVEIHARKNRFLTYRNLYKLIILLALLGAGTLGGYYISNLTATQPAKSNTKPYLNQQDIPFIQSQQQQSEKPISQSYINSEMYGDAPKMVVQSSSSFNQGLQPQIALYHSSASAPHLSDGTQPKQLTASHTQPVNVDSKTAVAVSENVSDEKPEGAEKGHALCNAIFTFYSNYDESIQFTPQAQSDEGLKLTWNFGDGTESHKNNPKHVYAKPGDYAVTLTVTNKRNSCKAEYAQLVKISQTAELTTTNVSGTVFADAEYANKLQVDLLEYNYRTNAYEWVQSTFTNTKGYYEFSEVTAGSYIIATASYKNYLPTFYGNNTDRNYATTLSVFAQDYSDLRGYDIQLVSNPWTDNTRTSNIDTSKTILLVFDENNNPVASIEVSKNGTIGSGNLPDGNYKLVNPATGESAGDLEVGKGKSKIKTPDAAGIGSGNNASVQSQLSLMPNPASLSVNVGLSNAENTSIEITIINTQGAVIKRQIIPAGNQSNNIDISDLSAGNYYVIAKQNGVTTTKTLVKSIDNSK